MTGERHLRDADTDEVLSVTLKTAFQALQSLSESPSFEEKRIYCSVLNASASYASNSGEFQKAEINARKHAELRVELYCNENNSDKHWIPPKYQKEVSIGWNNLGKVLGSLCRYDEALVWLAKAEHLCEGQDESWLPERLLYNHNTVLVKLMRNGPRDLEDVLSRLNRALLLGESNKAGWVRNVE